MNRPVSVFPTTKNKHAAGWLAAAVLALALIFPAAGLAQQTAAAKIEKGSQTAKNGFRNEDEIRDKFNNWRSDEDARVWLAAMNYKLSDIESVTAAKPHGEKADVEVRVKTKTGERREGISIKLVSSPNGFNQIDKRWLSHYVRMWKMPPDVENALKLYLGEVPPTKPSRDAKRMYLNELEPAQAAAVVEFFPGTRMRSYRTSSPATAYTLRAGSWSRGRPLISRSGRSARSATRSNISAKARSSSHA